MKVKLVNRDHAAGLIDPHTKRSPFLGPDGVVVEIADVPDTNFWVRREIAGEIERVASVPPGPVLAPVTPLTTR